MARLNHAAAIAALLMTAGCGGSGGEAHHPGVEGRSLDVRPPAGAMVEPWGWIGIRGRHAVLWYRGRRWTSAAAFHRPPDYVATAAVKGSHIAFAVEGRGLFVATFAGAERRIPGAGTESVLTWAPAGDLLDADRRGHIVARSAAGALLERWRVRGGATAVQPSGALLYLTPSGTLFRTDGERSVALVDAGRVVADPRAVDPLADGSVAVLGTRRLAVFSSAGHLTASAGTPSRRLTIQAVRAAPDGRGYAYVRTIRRAKGGTDRIELLVPGDRSRRTLATIPVSLHGCGWGSDVRWDGSWIRYRNADGRRLAVETSL
jgi:hypothetical protein